MDIEDFVDGATILGLNCTYSGNKIIKAYRLYLKRYDDFNNHRLTDNGSMYTIYQLCKESGVTSSSKPKVLVALCHLMLAEFYISSGMDSDASYCVHVVENIKITDFTLCVSTIRNCKDWIKDVKERL